MSCSGRYASATEYNQMMACDSLDLSDADVLAKVEAALDMAASDIHAALAAVGACDCTLATWATAYLKKLNVLDAAVLYNCPCGRSSMSSEARERWQIWLEKQYELIRSGKLSVCAGDSGSEYPAFGVAEMTYTQWNTEQILTNEMLRDL